MGKPIGVYQNDDRLARVRRFDNSRSPVFASDFPLTLPNWSDTLQTFTNLRLPEFFTVPYDSIVCVKQVPDTANVTAEAMKEDGTVNRAALPTIFNPEDLHALEAALELRDRYGGTVTVVSMGPPKAADVLRDCLYPRGRSGDSADRPSGGGQRHVGDQLYPQPGDPDDRPLRFRLLRPAGHRRRHGPGGAAVRREAGHSTGDVPGARSLAVRRRGADSPQHWAWLGVGRGEAARAGHGGADGQHSASAGGEAGDASEAGAGGRRRRPRK